MSYLWQKRIIMCIMTINTTKRTWLIHTNRPILLGLSALLLVCSVRSITLIRSIITRGSLILISFPLPFGRKGIRSCPTVRTPSPEGVFVAVAGVEKAREEEVLML